MPSPFKYRNRIWTLFAVIGLLLGVYLFLVGETIYNTLKAQKAEQDIKSMTADLSQLEFSYLSSQSKINMDLASSMGFVEPASIVVAKASSAETTAFISKSKI